MNSHLRRSLMWSPAFIAFGFGGGAGAGQGNGSQGQLPPPPQPSPLQFESVAQLEAENVDPIFGAVRLLGYDEAGDSGQAVYRRVASEPSHPGKIQSADGSWWEMAIEGPVSAKQFGAKGDGVTDDTAAFTNWITFGTNVPTRFSGVPDTSQTVQGCELYLPPGRYMVNLDTPISFEPSSTLHIRSDGMQAAEIVNQGTGYILTALDANHLAFRGFRVRGGAGFLKLTTANNNVRRHFFVEDVGFYDFSECAIGHNSQDMPFWKIRDCDILPNVSKQGNTSSIGFALNGLTDQVEITGCNFIGCKYAIKIGYGGNNAKIWSNFFAGPQNSDPGACIWVVPRPDGSAVNAGEGLDIDSNKFGNEGAVAGHKRILFADESNGSGSDFPSRNSHFTGVSAKYIQGVIVQGGLLAGNDINAPGLIYSYLFRVGGLNISNITFSHTKPTEALVQFDPAAAASATGQPGVKTNRIDLTLNSADNRGPVGTANTAAGLEPSNIPWMFTVLDPHGLAVGRPGVPLYWQAAPADLSYVSRTDLNIGTISVSTSGVSRTAVADPYGGSDAARLAFSDTEGYLGKTITAPAAGEVAWLEFDAKQGASTPLTLLNVTLRRNLTSFELVRQVHLSPKWQTMRFLFLMSSGSGILEIYFEPGDFEAGVRSDAIIFNPRIYEANQPVIQNT